MTVQTTLPVNLFKTLSKAQAGSTRQHLAFLDRGLDSSFLKADVSAFPARLQTAPDGLAVAPIGNTVALRNPARVVNLATYPALGQVPAIDTAALNFLHTDILEACVCVVSHSPAGLLARWSGRNALSPVQCWSATKFIPMLWLVSKAHEASMGTDVDVCDIEDVGTVRTFKQACHETMVDIVSYRNSVPDSNAKAATLSSLARSGEIEKFIERTTGSQNHQFAGRYGFDPLAGKPALVDRKSGKKLVVGPGTPLAGDNLIPVYVLVRLMSMLAWHHHLPAAARIPNAQWSSLESVVRALGTDTARYLDVAMETLKLPSRLRNPVVLSKLGFGESASRGTIENVYCGVVQFEDHSTRTAGRPATLRSLCLALRASRKPPTLQAYKDVDTRLAAEVTEILRRFIDGEFA